MSGQAAPEYRRAADVIKSRIRSGDLGIGSIITIPHIQDLAGTTYPTARRTAEHLASEGILQPHHGMGQEVIAVPEEAAIQRADTKELGTQIVRLQGQVQALTARPEVPADLRDTLERIEFNLEALYSKMAVPYPRDSNGEQQGPSPGARHERAR